MSDEQELQAEVEEPQKEEDQEQGIDVDALVSEKISEVEERFKKEIAGLNRKNSELSEMLKEKEQEAQNVNKTATQQVEELRQELRRKELREMRINKAAEAGNPKIASLLDIDTGTEEGMQEFVDAVKEMAEEMSNKKVEAEITKRFPADKEKPKGGKSNEQLSYADLNKMTPEEVAKLPKEVLDKIILKGE
jgi:hypothetical protein